MSTIYVPIVSPPTPAPSPHPSVVFNNHQSFPPDLSNYDPASLSRREFASLSTLPPSVRRRYLLSILNDCTPSELLFVSTTIAPLLKRDFLRELPPEIALHVVSFITDPKSLARASQVSKQWRALLSDEWMWKRMCESFQFDLDLKSRQVDLNNGEDDDEPLEEMEQFAILPMDSALQWLAARKRQARKEQKSFPLTITRESAASQFGGPFSYRQHFKLSYETMMNWRRGGQLLRAHRMPVCNPDNGVVTSVALDEEWVVVGLSNCRIHVFSAKTGVLSRTLIGHELGVWAVHLVSRGGFFDREDVVVEDSHPSDSDGSDPRTGEESRRRPEKAKNVDGLTGALSGLSLCVGETSSVLPAPGLHHLVPPSLRTALGLDQPQRTPRRLSQSWYSDPPRSPHGESNDPAFVSDPDVGKPSDVCCASEGWGQPNALVVSGGCDKVLRVWDVKSGYCIYMLDGHTSTIRCIKVLHNRPIAVTGSRDSTLRVWDVQCGRLLRVLEGHQQSVRCLDVCGNKVVSGSYDTTCRLWDVDTGECIHVLRGHFHQIYSVAFDGRRIASGGLDTTVRVWDAVSGICLALLQGHTALVCQLQLSPIMLATGGSDGRVITFSLSTFTALQRIAAHDSSVTSLQFDSRFLVTGGNDGRVRLFETLTGNYVRELSEPCDCVWKVVYRKATCAIMCKRAGKTVMEIWSFKPSGVQGPVRSAFG